MIHLVTVLRKQTFFLLSLQDSKVSFSDESTIKIEIYETTLLLLRRFGVHPLLLALLGRPLPMLMTAMDLLASSASMN
jgi:hypothetical protein